MKISLRTKFLAGILGSILLLGAVILFFTYHSVSNKLKIECQKRGIMLARHISVEIAPIVKSGDKKLARKILLQHLKRETDVEYLFIVSSQGQIFAHTFSPNEVPLFLKTFNSPNLAYVKINEIKTSKGLVFDISYPIQKGELGILHIGMNSKSVTKGVNYIINRLVLIILVVLGLGGILAASLAHFVSRPVLDLIQATKAIKRGKFDQVAKIISRDEIGQLARTFNEMTKEIKQVRADLSEARDYAANIIENMFESLIITDVKGTIKDVNKATLTLLKYQREELIGQSIRLILPKETIFTQSVNQLIRTGLPVLNDDLVYISKDGQRIPVSASFSLLKQKETSEIICLAKDIRETKRLITELSQIYNSIPLPARVIDSEFNIISQNEAMSKLTGIEPDKAIGKKCYELFGCSFCQTPKCTLRLVLQGRQKVEREEIRTLSNSKKIPCQLFGSPFKDSEGKTIGAIEVFVDTTAKRKFIEELEKKTESLHLALATNQAIGDVLTTLASTIELQPMLEEVLTKIVNYVYSQLAVIYLCKDEYLNPVVSYALDINKIPSFKMGEGLPGQCAKGKRQIIVDEVPPDYFRVVSGSGERAPNHIVCLPIIFRNKLLGVLEIAAFNAFSKEDLNFLTVVVDQIGVGINHSLTYQKAESLAQELREKNELLLSQNEELKSQGEELMALNEELKAQTEELAAQKKALEEKTREVQEANRLKSEFLSNMSHELRTPLNAILGMAKLLKTGVGGEISDRQRDYLEIIERNGHNLLALINDVLDLSKIEAGKVDIIWNKLELKSFVEDILKSVRMLAEEKGLELKSVFKGDVDYIITDPEKVRQILLNLLSNAIKFTEKGEVTVIVEAKDGKVFLSVKDTGIGIPEEALDYIFDAFRQVDGSTTRKYGGTGLGLSIVKKLVELLGGEIRVKSKLNEGSTFTVVLPKEPISKEKLEKNLAERMKTAFIHSQTTETAFSETGPKPQVLIIDDDPIVVRELSVLLKDENLDIFYAFSGDKGLEFIKKLKPDLVILDLKMPEMDGFDVLKQTQEDETIKDIPVIVLSAMDLTKEEKQKLTPNVKATLLKGQIDKASLIEAVRKVLFPKMTKPKLQEEPSLKSKVEKCLTGPAKILIVEDNPDNLFLLKEVLKDAEYTIYTAENGAQAIEQAQKIKPDLIIMDMLMPVMDGYEATRRLRRDPMFKNVPIIGLTARAMRGDREKVLEAGCDDYLPKPVDPFVFKKKVKEWLMIRKTKETKNE